MSDARKVAEVVRRACVAAALEAYEDAGLQGLCQEGRWECAVEAIRGLDLDPVLEAHRTRDAEQAETGRSAGDRGHTGDGR
jgi:hypothetical protein